MDKPVYITALYDDFDAASRTLSSLATAGMQPDDICVAMNRHDALMELCERLATVPIEYAIAQQLAEAGVDPARAAYCEERVRAGDVLLLLRITGDSNQVNDVLRAQGGDVSDPTRPEHARISLHEEQLSVRKEPVTDGEVCINKVVTQHIAHIEVPFTTEEVVIRQTPANGEPRVWRIPLAHEEIVVEKRPVVTNEVTVRSELIEHVRHVQEPIRKEQLRVHARGSSAGDQLTTFDGNGAGNSSLSKPNATEKSMDLQQTTREFHAFFPDRISAETAAQELRDSGIDDDAVRVEADSPGFLEGVKRFFSGEQPDGSGDAGAVLIVYSQYERVSPVIERYGGRLHSGGDQRDMQNADDTRTASQVSDEEPGTMRLHEERLDVRKHEAKQGEVRLTKDVVTERQEIDVPVKREEVVLNRRRVDEVDDGAQINDGQEIRIPVMREDVTVEKHPVVTEEVGVEKREFDRTEHVTANVQKERARLETEGRVGTTLNDVD